MRFQLPLTDAAKLLASQLTNRVAGEGAWHWSRTDDSVLTIVYVVIHATFNSAYVKQGVSGSLGRCENHEHVAPNHELPIRQHARSSHCRAQQPMPAMCATLFAKY